MLAPAPVPESVIVMLGAFAYPVPLVVTGSAVITPALIVGVPRTAC